MARIVAVSASNDVAFLVLQGDPATSKSRLNTVLSPQQRIRLTRYCLSRITSLVDRNLIYLLAENSMAASEGHRLEIRSISQQGSDLNTAIAASLVTPELSRYHSVTIVPNDLPFLNSLEAYMQRPTDDVCLITPDSHLTGTNLLRVPRFMANPTFSYGPNSFFQHVRIAKAKQLEIAVTPCSHAFDIDTPEDLTLAQEAFPDAELWSML
jgi:2-phospho-L-lactate guanylyltransferase